MPIYEYECRKCGKVNEFLFIGKEEEKLCCIECGSEDMSKMMSAHNTSGGSSSSFDVGSMGGGCCGSPNSCGTPGACCGGH
jgi:putative FmdB family regulatory protein